MTTQRGKINKALARKVLEVVDAGLVNGVGRPEPGHMCVEAAVCYALGEPHGDKPSCVGAAVRAYKIKLNDARWPSNEARTQGMREIAIAQLGSDGIDQKAFAHGVIIKGVQRILPLALRAVAKLFPSHADALEAASVVCEAAIDLATARTAAVGARDTARKTRRAAYAAADAAYAAYAADAAADAAYAAADAADAAYAAYAADAAADAARVKVLRLACDIGVDVLRELKSPGVKWLGLCKDASR